MSDRVVYVWNPCEGWQKRTALQLDSIRGTKLNFSTSDVNDMDLLTTPCCNMLLIGNTQHAVLNVSMSDITKDKKWLCTVTCTEVI